jgi:chromosomal replication initiation ATPase DnaA
MCWVNHGSTEKKAALARLEGAARMRVIATSGVYINRPPTTEELLSFVCLEARVPLETLKTDNLRRSTISIRSVASYLLREDLHLGVVDAAVVLELKNTSSVSIAHRTISDKINNWDRTIINLLANIRAHYLPL